MPTFLIMPDGSTASIPGRSDLLNLLVVAARGVNISPEQATQLDLIRRSTVRFSRTAGRLVELIRCCLLGPHAGAGIPEIPVAGSDQAVDM